MSIAFNGHIVRLNIAEEISELEDRLIETS